MQKSDILNAKQLYFECQKLLNANLSIIDAKKLINEIDP